MAEHLPHLHLHEHGLIINPAKCQFGQASMHFVGYHITPIGLILLRSKVEMVQQPPNSTTVRALQEFLGMVNHLMRPLYAVVKTPKHVITCSERILKAFSDTKAALVAVTMLAHLVLEAPVALTAGASDCAVGAVF